MSSFKKLKGQTSYPILLSIKDNQLFNLQSHFEMPYPVETNPNCNVYINKSWCQRCRPFEFSEGWLKRARNAVDDVLSSSCNGTSEGSPCICLFDHGQPPPSPPTPLLNQVCFWVRFQPIPLENPTNRLGLLWGGLHRGVLEHGSANGCCPKSHRHLSLLRGSPGSLEASYLKAI